MNSSVVKLNLLLDATGFNSEIAKTSANVKSVAIGLASLAVGASVLSDLGSAAVEMSIDFEQSFAKVETLFGDVAVDTDNLEQEIIELSNATGIAANELNEGLYQALSAGVPVTEDMAEAMEFLTLASYLSIAGFTDVASAVDITTTVLNSYGMEIDETARVMNVLIETQNAGKTTVDELASTMGKAIPSAASLGVEFEELAAATAVLTANGISTAETMTQLKALFTEMINPASEVNEIFSEIAGETIPEFLENGGSFIEVMTLLNDELEEQGKAWQELSGSQEAWNAATILTKDGGEDLQEVFDGLTDDTYELEEAYKTMNTTQMNINRISRIWENTLKDLGDMIMEVTAPAIELLADNFEWLAPIILTVAILSALAGVGFGIIAIYSVAASLGMWELAAATLAATWEFALIVIAIVAVVLALWWCYENVEWFQKSVNFLLGMIVVAWWIFSRLLVYFMDEIAKRLVQLYEEHETAFKIIGLILLIFMTFFIAVFVLVIVAGFIVILLALWAFVGFFDLFFEMLGTIVQTFIHLFDDLVLTFLLILDFWSQSMEAWAEGDWSEVWKNIANIVIAILNGLLIAFNTFVNAATELIYEFVTGVANMFIALADLIPGVNVDFRIGEMPELAPTPLIPYFAKGGIVDGATLSVVGEAGPEMILPLNSQGANFLSTLGISGMQGGGETNVFVEIGSVNNVDNVGELASEIIELVDVGLGKKVRRRKI